LLTTRIPIALRVLIGVLLIAPPTAVSADPILVTAGGYSLDSTDPSGFAFHGQGFVLRGDVTSANSGALRTCFPCAPGTTIDMSVDASGLVGQWVNRPDLPVMFEGESYSTVYYSGTLRFDAPGVTAPPFDQPNPTALLRSPFTFSAQLSAFGDRGLTGVPLFTVNLIGSGTARVTLRRAGDEYRFVAQGYQFANLDPIPEPATLGLIGAGITLLGLRRRNKHNPFAPDRTV